MCNTCNVNYTGGCYNTAQTSSCCGNNCGCGCHHGCGLSWLWGCGAQRVCRDSCGNLRVRNAGSCCNTCNSDSTCGSCNSCNTCNPCKAYSTYACNQTAQATQTNATSCADAYYARQYALYPYGRVSGCCGSGFSTVNTVDASTL